jgi:undecaprenyl diphosphate synthase
MIEQISRSKVPQHIAIIMDGNGRWAKEKGQERLFGHVAGVEAVRNALKAATEVGVKYLTIYAFSTENWSRPKEEVDGLMDLLVQTIANEVDDLNKDGVRLLNIGDQEGLPEKCRTELNKAIEATRENKRINLVLALNYSAKSEITNAVKNIAQRILRHEILPSSINEAMISNHLMTHNIPDPELMIRTSGENRISNFLLWQLAYAEFVFLKKNWPDFSQSDLFEAIIEYQSRERRFGKVSEQLHT